MLRCKNLQKILYFINHTEVKIKDNLKHGFSISLLNAKGDLYISDKYSLLMKQNLKNQYIIINYYLIFLN